MLFFVMNTIYYIPKFETTMREFQIRKGRVSDCKAVYELIKELAIYERAGKEVDISEKQLEEDGFGPRAIYNLLVAEQKGKVIGMALYYEKYSTWKGRSIYLEDLIVTAEMRGIGAGKALFEAVMQEAKKRGSGRMEWQVLEWNQPAIDFYASYGANLDSEWINGKFTKEQLQRLME